MKPCFWRKSQLGLLAVGELDARPAQALREHLATCAGCRNYLASLSNVATTLAAVETTSDLRTSEAFHRKVLARVQRQATEPWWRLSHLRDWRFALPAAAAGVVVLLVVVLRNGGGTPGPVNPAPIASASSMAANLPPTIANYRMAAGESAQELDDFLTELAEKSVPPAPAGDDSLIALANATY
jgi:predicted anti-sigma-YlaC factor YlaD